MGGGKALTSFLIPLVVMSVGYLKRMPYDG